MLEKVVGFLTKLMSQEFAGRLTAFVFQISREDLPGEEKKRLAVDFGVAVINELQAAAVKKLPGGFPQWIAGQIMSWLDGAEREWIGQQVEVIWTAMKGTTGLLKANPQIAAELLGGKVVENRIVLPVDVPERPEVIAEFPPTPPALAPDPEAKANLVEQIKSKLAKSKDK